MSLWKKLRQWATRSEMDLDREMRSHLDLEAEELRDAGQSPDDAGYGARRAFGNTTAIKEDVRALSRWASLARLWQDLRYAVRILCKMPGFTAVTILSLTLGIGLNSAVFSLINALTLRPLPTPEPARIVRIFQDERGNTSWRNFRDLQANSKTLEALAAFSWPVPLALTATGESGAHQTEKLWGAAVSSSYFEVLGVQPQIGRIFLAEEDESAGDAPVVILGDQLWRTRFDASPSVIGRTVKINGNPFQVIGVAPAKMPQPDGMFTHQLWVPASMCGQIGVGNRLPNRRQTWLRMLGRLQPRTTLTQFNAEANVIAKQMESANGEDARELSFAGYPEPRGRFVGIPGLREFGWILQAIVILVLVIACANIANLQLARSLARTKEIAIRMAIGAGRGRILRQFLTESLLLTLLGGTLGLLTAFWGAGLLLRLAPPLPQGIQLAIDVSPDWRVLSFGLGTSLLAGIVFGAVTALSAARQGLNPLLKSGEMKRPERTWLSPRKLLVAGQVGLSVVLLVAAGLFVESLANARRMDLGFQPENRLIVEVDGAMLGYQNEQRVTLYAEILRRLRELPGVISASTTAVLPLSGGYLGDGYVWPEGDAEASEAGRPMVYFDRVGPEYFKAMGASLVRGREFTERDSPDPGQAAVVNETFAQTFWPGENAIGKRFRSGSVDKPLIEIVGIVRDGKYNSLGEAPQKHVYQAMKLHFGGGTFILHTTGDPLGIAGPVRAEVQRIDPEVPLTIKTMKDHLGFAFSAAELGAKLLGAFAVLGLLLSAVGLYGMLVFVVNRSIPEIGIRIALGASPRGVQLLFIRRGLMMVLAGAIPGVLAALAATRLLMSYLYGVNPLSPGVWVSVALLLLMVAYLACSLPSKKAVRIAPLTALRHD